MPLLTPPARRSRLASAARIASRAAGTTLVSSGLVAKLPGSRPKRVVTSGRAALVGGVVAGAAGFLLRRRGDRPPGPPGPAPGTDAASPTPAASNYDTGGPPPDITAPGPVIDASAEPLGIDEDAEVQAAAAEAANIGGPEIDYARAEPDMTAGDTEAAVFDETPEPANPPSDGSHVDEGR